MLFHFYDESLRRSGLLMPRAPDQQFQQYRREINTLFRQPVIHSSRICFLRLGSDDPKGLKFLQTIRQNVRGNPFSGILELLECPEPANH